MASQLEASGEYRVLRRLRPRDVFREPDGEPTKIAILVDVETTGLDAARDEIIELGMVAFEFSAAKGHVYRVLGRFDSFRDPGIPIPQFITALTSITDDMVEGASIDADAVAAFVTNAAVVIAHKADFDRRFVERAWPEVFEHLAWACSMSEIDWATEGIEGTKLGYLIAGRGWFHEAHRAVEDCMALLEALAAPLPRSGETALKRLLDTARKRTVRIWAEHAPIELKDILKARGYRWNDGTDGRPRSWWKDVDAAVADDEVRYLQAEIYQRDDAEPIRQVINAFVRHSARA